MSTIKPGRWELYNYKVQRTQVSPDSSLVVKRQIKDWLSGVFADRESEVKPASGLIMETFESQEYTEINIGCRGIDWYDVDGILDSSVTPFNGKILLVDADLLLLPDTMFVTGLKKNEISGVYCRYDDGDTLIRDGINIIDNVLYRTVNIVTDQLYLDRILYCYRVS